MDIDEFRSHAHQMVDWMADYMDRVEDLPVRAQTAPGEVDATLPRAAPAQGEPISERPSTSPVAITRANCRRELRSTTDISRPYSNSST